MASPSSNTSAAFLASVESMCKKYTAQVRQYQDEMTAAEGGAEGRSRARALPEGTRRHMGGVFAALKELSRYVCYEPDLNAYAYYEYELISQLLVLAWKSTVYVADIVAHLQQEILCTGVWLSRHPSDPATVPACLQGYRLYCRIAESCIDYLRSGMRMKLVEGARGHQESMLMLMNTKVDAERETLENWLKTLHNDMSSTVTSVEKKLTLLSFPAQWE
mmetsp:Transcript_16026/g.33066  ORF Transcript_16026/g.33066 Transcript_16026/m.33066 type:complete len:219 (+) Transcript_16026:316-972(+)